MHIDTYSRYRERWFLIDLKQGVCHTCFLRDKGKQTPFLMSIENNIDLGELLAHLLALIQVEEMIIAWSHIQMLVHQYHSH
jgi:hypothetical protein